MMQYAGLVLLAAMQMLAVAFCHARQFDVMCFNAGSLLLQGCVLTEAMSHLEAWYGREWWSFPRSASVTVCAIYNGTFIGTPVLLNLLLRHFRLRRTRVAAVHGILTLRKVVMIGHMAPKQHANAFDTRRRR